MPANSYGRIGSDGLVHLLSAHEMMQDEVGRVEAMRYYVPERPTYTPPVSYVRPYEPPPPPAWEPPPHPGL